VGILLIFISEFTQGEKSEKKENQTVSGNHSYESYADDTEKRLREILEKIEGVGKAEVMVTIVGTEEYIYAQEEKVKNGKDDFSSESEYVLIGSGGEKQALLRKVMNPQINGIVVICEGGDSNIVKERIYNSVSAVFNISASQIYVTKLK